MQTHFGAADFPTSTTGLVLTSGSFDGVHHGHQKILQRLREACPEGLQTAVLTFDPHPREILKPESAPPLLTTLPEKAELLETLGINHLVVLRFDKSLAQTPSEVFIQETLLQRLNTQLLVMGYDHKFGRNREGSFEFMKANEEKLGLKVEEIPRQDVDAVTVSSTKIRQALLQGELNAANRYLGYNYRLRGPVVRGNQLGRTLGFPTANVQPPDPRKLLPRDGIYAVEVLYEGKCYGGMLSIGLRPTVGDNLARTFEVNIFDFNEDIYEKEITLCLVKFLRVEEKYDSLEKLTTQLREDERQSKMALNYSGVKKILPSIA